MTPKEWEKWYAENSGGSNVQWRIIHDTLEAIWKRLNGETPMPEEWPQHILDSMDMNVKVIHADLLNILEAASGDGQEISQHIADKNNPHDTTAAQTGAYSTTQVDNIAAQLASNNYLHASYFFGKTQADTVVQNPVNAAENYFDFTTNTPYTALDDLSGWEEGSPITPGTNMVIGITDSFLDLAVDSGYPGKAIYNEGGSWDYYPDKGSLNPFTTNSGGYIVGADPSVPENAGKIAANGNGTGSVIGLVDILFPVGSTFKQEPWDLSPVKRGWPGVWENWDYRAYSYALAPSAPTAAFITDWKAKRHDIWNLNTDGTVATRGTKKYTKPVGLTYALRQDIHGEVWNDSDLVEGYQIPDGPNAGWYIWQVITPAGLYTAIEDLNYQGGGYRPPFNQGVAPDVMRQIKASLLPGFIRTTDDSVASGAFDYLIGGHADIGYGNKKAYPISGIDSSLVVSTGPQNAPVTASCILWRRTG